VQVHELHRLYRVQKLLVNDMKAELKRQRKSSNVQTRLDRWSTENETESCYIHQNQRRPCQPLDLELPAEEYIEKDTEDAVQEVEEENDLELTLATGSRRRRKNENNSFTSDSGASFSSSSTESGGVKLNGNDWGLFHVPDINITGYQSQSKSKMSEERVARPPWLFQCLSLNMT